MDWGARLVELVRRALKSAAQSRIIRKNLYHNFDCALEQKKTPPWPGRNAWKEAGTQTSLHCIDLTK